MRFSVTQPAVIARPGKADIACEIRDFCLGGLFLKFTHADEGADSFAGLEDAYAEIVFSPASASAEPGKPPRVFRVQAQLQRSSPSGVGVAFARQPVEALRALQKLRMASHRLRLGASPVTPNSNGLRETCTTLLRETLMQAHDQLSRMLEDRLSLAAMHAVGITEHSGLLNAPLEFKTHAKTVQTKWLNSVLDALDPRHTPAKPAGNDDLALVDEMDFEDWLSTSSEVTRLEAHFKEQLADIEPRVAQLFAFPVDHLSNPFGPSLICHLYRDAIQDMQILAKARSVAYATLREVLTEQLTTLYAELLAWLPVSETELADRAARPRAPPAEPKAKPSELPSASDSESTPAASGTLGRLTHSLMDFFRNAPAPAAMPAALADTPPGDATGPAASSAPLGASPRPETSPVLQRLSAAGAMPQNLNPEMRRSVDMFGALFDTVHAEKSVSEGIRPFFSQLEASLVKLAVSDPAFLGSPSHPAHKVLNTLDRISMIAGEDGKITDTRLLRLMGRWTDRINAEAEKNPGIFEEARTQLERVVKPLLNERIARISRLQEICEGRQRAEETKSRILVQLLDNLGERVIPSIVIELLNGGWRNVLLRAELRYGEDSDEVRAAWHAIEQLSAWLDPEHDAHPAAAEAQDLLRYIDTHLSYVCADKFAQDRILDQLAHALFDPGENAAEYTTISAKLRPAVVETLSAEQGDLVEKLRVGDWLQFTDLDAPLNLVWIGDKPPVYVFASYRGIKKLDIKRHDLLQALEKNAAQWTEDMELPLMDRSYSAMIQKMQRDLIWQASHDPVTGLANRRAFFRAIRRDWVRNQNPDLDPGYVIGIIQTEAHDLEGNAPSADTRYAFVREMAQRIEQQLPPGSLLARAGEQAIAYWSAMPDTISAKLTATKLLNTLNRLKLSIDHHDIQAKTYIGLIWVNNGLDPEHYYDHANAASTAARESDQNAVVLHHNIDLERDKPAIPLAGWARELTRILAKNRLELHCQAILDIQQVNEPMLYEILLRPVADDSAAVEQINTHDLVSVAERLQRITEIDRWVFKNLIQWMRAHSEQLDTLGGFVLKISGQSVVNPLFLNFLSSELGRGDIPPHKIIFAISELAAVEGHSQAQHFIRQLQRMGCQFMLDEFGLGTSSYTALKSLKLHYLKIDRSLVRELSTSLIDEAIVRSILETCAFLEIRTVAGFVENEDMQTKLTEMGVQHLQGYLLSEPVALASLAQ